jgi:hypothetical protein
MPADVTGVGVSEDRADGKLDGFELFFLVESSTCPILSVYQPLSKGKLYIYIYVGMRSFS